MKTLGNLFRSVSGATAITFAVSSVAVIGVTAVAIDGARYYLERQRVQNAIDAAVLAGAANIQGVDAEREGIKVFHANYQAGFGTEVVNVRVNRETRFSTYAPTDDAAVAKPVGGSRGQPSKGRDVYTGNVTGSAYVRINHSMVQLLGAGDNGMIVAEARATNLLEENRIKLELALVADITGSMAGQPLEDLKSAMKYAIDLLFEGADEMENIFVSIIPYSTSVAIDPIIFPQARNWIQSYWQPRWDTQLLYTGWTIPTNARGYVSNRNNDDPPSAHIDASDMPPTTDLTRFRTPSAYMGTTPPGLVHIPVNPAAAYPNTDSEMLYGTAPPSLIFAENRQAPLHANIDQFIAAGFTRVNVGAMWGWFTLSPRWQGVWSAAKPNLPLTAAPNVKKIMVLGSDGENVVFLGHPSGVPGVNVSNDNDSLLAICTAAKAAGIEIYTFLFRTTANQALMQQCATDPAHFFYGATSTELDSIFRDIINNIKQSFIRLSR